MITICPQCQLPLAVTAADLRVAQGQVRCGRCAAVFNALASLYEPAGGSPERRAAAGNTAPISGAGGGSATAPGASATTEPESRPSTTAAAASPGASGGLHAPPPPGTSGLFRAPRRDDEPRFDDTHGADDWPPDSPASVADAPRAPDGTADAPDRTGAAPDEDVATEAPHEAAADAGAPRDTTDTFVREAAFAAGDIDFDLGPPDELAPSPAPSSAPAPAPVPAPDRDWAIDTMTAAELAALVARTEHDEPPEFASIRIAVDEASEITVLPSESPTARRPDPAAAPPQRQQAAGPVRATGSGAEALRERDPGRTFPRLAQAADDDPDLAGAQRAAEQRRAAMPPGKSSLRWLELEPAPPPAPIPDGALDASAIRPASTDEFTAAAGAPGHDESAPTGNAAEERATLPEVASAASAADDGTAWIPGGIATRDTEPRPGALAAALGLDAQLRPLETAPRAASWQAEADDAAAAPSQRTSPQEPGADADAADTVVAELAGEGAARPVAAPRWMWAATVVFGLALVAQLVHLYREELVAQPALREPLTRVYAALGRPLEPRWELGRYELRQQGVVAEPVAAGTLTVRASIRNGAGRAQPAPLLRVTLQDRFGNRIATRDLTPREYGGAAAIAPAPMLAPGQRIDAEVSLLDPGGEAVGFELDVCLRRTDGMVSCANDAPAING